MTLGRWLWLGSWGGMVGGVLEKAVVMTNAGIMGQSIFTPAHMVAVPVVGEGPMMAAMKGGAFYLEPVPALLGLIGHFLWSGPVWGLAFGLVAAALRLSGQAALWTGPAYGIAVGLFMSAVVLPIFGMKPMWEMAGWLVFTLAHLAYGLGPGIVVWQGTRAVAPTAAAAGPPRQRAA
jgi:uncharacterized membrane protein YagU involved in acid resistance